MAIKNNRIKKLLLLVSTILLLLALMDGWPYEFFTLLRFVVCGSTAYVAWLSYKVGQENWSWFLGAIAILFNPLFPIYLTREVWVITDVMISIILFLCTFHLELNNDN